MNEMSAVAVQEMIDRASDRASALGVNVCIAVVDGGAHLKAFLRMDGAILGAVDVAQRKARTSVLFCAESGSFGQLVVDEQLLGMELSNGGLAGFHGGVPVHDDGSLMGAIGVSGASAEQDREIARAGAGQASL